MNILHVEADFLVDTDVLHVRYSVANNTAEPVYLFNVLWDYSSTGEVIEDSVGAYISFGDEADMRVGKILHPPPKEKLVEQTIVPYARRLDSGTVWKDTLSLSLPVREHNPYYPEDEQTEWQEVEIKSAELWLSWVPELDGLKLHPSPFESAFRLQHPELLRKVQIEKSSKVPVVLHGRRRLDQFERF